MIQSLTMTTLVKLQVIVGSQIKTNQQNWGVTHYVVLKANASITLLFYDTLECSIIYFF